jgi:hypothetical protein
VVALCQLATKHLGIYAFRAAVEGAFKVLLTAFDIVIRRNLLLCPVFLNKLTASCRSSSIATDWQRSRVAIPPVRGSIANFRSR